VDYHVGLGAAWIGPLPKRDDDVAGLTVQYVHLSNHTGAGFTDDRETAIELFYKLQITPYLSIKPDLQYIINPGGTGVNDALVGTLRSEIVF
jgi:porin